MKKLNRSQGIAVFACLAVLAYLFFSEPIMSLFNMKDNNQTSETPKSGVEVREILVGTGEIAQVGDTLTVHYVGKLTNGKVFDSSRDTNTPISFILGAGQVIRGWDEGLQGMRVGGKRVLAIAPDYAYGSRGIGPIPPNSTLIFEVELLDVKRSQ